MPSVLQLGEFEPMLINTLAVTGGAAGDFHFITEEIKFLHPKHDLRKVVFTIHEGCGRVSLHDERMERLAHLYRWAVDYFDSTVEIVLLYLDHHNNIVRIIAPEELLVPVFA